MRIGELSARTGVSVSAIRYYEQEGLLPPPARRSGKRLFEEGAVARLAVVRLAAETGFTLAEIRQLVTEFGRHRWRRLAERKLDEIGRAVARLETMADLLGRLVRCACPDLEFCGRALKAAERRGAERPRGRLRRRAGALRAALPKRPRRT